MLFFTENLGFFRFSFVFFGLFRNSLFRLFCFYTETESFDVSIEPKQTEDPPKQFKREYIWVCFGLLRNRSVCFGCFVIGSKHRNKPNFLVFGFTKRTETNAKQILFRFVSVRTEIYFCLFRGHPRAMAPLLLSILLGLADGEKFLIKRTEMLSFVQLCYLRRETTDKMLHLCKHGLSASYIE